MKNIPVSFIYANLSYHMLLHKILSFSVTNGWLTGRTIPLVEGKQWVYGQQPQGAHNNDHSNVSVQRNGHTFAPFPILTHCSLQNIYLILIFLKENAIPKWHFNAFAYCFRPSPIIFLRTNPNLSQNKALWQRTVQKVHCWPGRSEFEAARPPWKVVYT